MRAPSSSCVALLSLVLTLAAPRRAVCYAPDRSSSSRRAVSPANANSESDNPPLPTNGRRAFLSSVAASALAPAAALASSFGVASSVNPARALAAASGDELADVYFGVGCFWHIQHEFLSAEKRLLGRSNKELTSLAGYAGGTKTDKEGRVCYHNLQGVADYGKLGHGEVVGMTIPESSIGDFAKEYFSYFSPKGERVDPGDRGGEYRSLIGLPGGTSNPQYSAVEAAASERGMKLEPGKGNDPDTFGKKLVYVYDTSKFPFYQAEVYHQYHNDFQSPPYGKAYNGLADAAFDDGRIKITGCPDRVGLNGNMSWRGMALIVGIVGVLVAAAVAVARRTRLLRTQQQPSSSSYTSVKDAELRELS